MAEAPSRRRRLTGQRLPWALLGTAFAARVAAVALTTTQSLAGDAIDYDRLARRLAAGHGFGPSILSPSGGPTAFRAPLYPLFVSGLYRVTGNSRTGARVLEALVGTVAVGLIGLLASQLFGRRTGVIATAIAAIYPPLVLSSVSVLSEALIVPLEILAIVAALRAREGGSRRGNWIAVAGAAGGLGVLTRPNTLVMLPFLAALVIRPNSALPPVASRRLPGPRRWWAVASAPALLLIAAGLVVLPWQVRNQLTVHRFVPITDIDGFNLAGVYNDAAARSPYPTHLQWRAPSAVPAEAHWFSDRSLNEVTLADRLRSDALAYIREHPTAVPGAMFWNSYRMFDLGGPFERNPVGQELGYGAGMATLEAASFWLMLALALAGSTLGAWRQVPKSLLLVPVALWAITVPFLGNARLRVPIEPFLVLPAAVAVTAVFAALERRSGVQLQPARP